MKFIELLARRDMRRRQLGVRDELERSLGEVVVLQCTASQVERIPLA